MELLINTNDIELLKKTVETLANKRGQPIKTVTHLVQESMKFMNSIQNQ